MIAERAAGWIEQTLYALCLTALGWTATGAGHGTFFFPFACCVPVRNWILTVARHVGIEMAQE